MITNRTEQPAPPDAAEVAAQQREVQAFLDARGWTLQGWDYDHGWFIGPGNFAGRAFNFDLSQWPWNEPLKLECEVDLGHTGAPLLTITTCGVNGGCAKHRCRTLRIPFTSLGLRQTLTQLEREARDIDAAELSECLLFGPCGRLGT